MASTDLFEGMFAGQQTPVAPQQPEAQERALPAPQQGDDIFSGMFDASLAAKAKAAGTTASPQDAGSALKDSVRTGTPTEAIKADPAAFKQTQQVKQASAAIDSDPDVAAYINSVPDAAAISADDWKNLARVGMEAAKAFPKIANNIFWNAPQRFIGDPGAAALRGSWEEMKQAYNLAFPTDSEMNDTNAIARTWAAGQAGFHLGMGILGVVSTPYMPFIDPALDVLEKLGIPRDQAALALFAIGVKRPEPSFTGERPASARPASARESMENIAAYYKEFTPDQIKTWTTDELFKYVNQKMGAGSAATELSQLQLPKPGVDKAFDEVHVAQAKANDESLDAMLNAVQSSKTKEVSPEAMEAWLNMKGLAGRSVWLDAKTAAEVYGTETPSLDDGKLGWIDDVAARLPEAAELGAEIEVPLSKYLANVDPAVHSMFADKARIDDSLSPQEAKDWVKAWHDDYVKDAEAEDIANAEKNPEERLPSNSKPQEYGAENFMPLVSEQGKMPRQAPKTPTSPAAQTYPNEKVYNAGLKVVLDSGEASAPFVQRELAKQGINLTYQQATQLMAVMEKRGVVGPFGEGGKRDVLVGKKKTQRLADLEPMGQEITAKPGANTARLAKLLGPKLYGEPTNMDQVTVKELLQNAADAVDAAVEKGLIPQGQILLKLDLNKRLIKMTDNGTGMAPETLAKEFLEIAGTKKETTQASGGLGIAKMLINFANKGLHVMTMREGKVSELHTHGEELFASLEDPSLAPKITVRAPNAADKAFFPDGHGTHIEVTIPETYKDSQTGEQRTINFNLSPERHLGLVRSPLFGSKVSVIVDDLMRGMTSLPIGSQFPVDNFTQFPPAKFDWGTAQIYVSKAPRAQNYSWQDNIHFLSNGIWQYSDRIRIRPQDWSSNLIPHEFYIDLHPKVKPEDAGYPFDLNRQGLTRDAKKSMDQVMNYLSIAYQQLDFAAQAKSYGSISYITPAKGTVKVSTPTPLEPKMPAQKTSLTGMKESDKIEFKGDAMYVNGKKMPSLSTDDLGKAEIKIDELMVDQKLIRPDQVMLHSSMETKVGAEDPARTENIRKWEEKIEALQKRIEQTTDMDEAQRLEDQRSFAITKLRQIRAGKGPLDALATELQKMQWQEELDVIEGRLAEIDKEVEGVAHEGFYEGSPEEKKLNELDVEYKDLIPRRDELRNKLKGGVEGEWMPLDEAARQKFGARFDEFMFDVGHTFLRLRDWVAMNVKGYEGLRKEAIGISFDTQYHGVSIRVPFSGSFVNPALTKDFGSPLLEAAGIHGTMIHELAHHKVRSHGVEFEAAMADIQAHVDAEMLMILNRMIDTGYNSVGAMNALAKVFENNQDIEAWLRDTILDTSRTRTRGRRIKGAGEERGPEGEGGVPEGAPERQGAEPGEGRPTQSGDIHSPNAKGRGFLANESEQLANVILHAEKRDLYLAGLFKTAKDGGYTQKEFNLYAKKLQNMDEADYEKALAAAHKEVERTLTPEWQSELAKIRDEVRSDLQSAPNIAANMYYRQGKLPTGETVSPLPKLDKTAVEYMTNADLKAVTEKGATHPDDAAMGFGFQSGRELVQALADFDRDRGRATVDKHLNSLIDQEADRRMGEKHGDIRERIAERAQEIAVENHHVDILIDELKQLAKQSGQIPFTLDQIKSRVSDLFDRVPHREAKFTTYQRAVFKNGRAAEQYLLEGKIDKAFKAKQTQLFAVLAAKEARSFGSYKKSNENTFDRIAKNATLGGVEQEYTDYAADILAGVGYMQPRSHLPHGSYADFLAEHNGSIASAYWITDPSQIRMIDGKPVTYDQMNTEEFTALAKTIQSILHNGRNAKKINTLFGKADLDNALFDFVKALSRWPDKVQPKGALGIRGGIVKGTSNWISAAHMLVERMMDYADKFDPRGPFSTYIDRPMREAYNEEIKLGEAAAKKAKYIRQKYVDSSIHDVIDNREILDPLNDNKPMLLTRWNLRQIMGYAGSELTMDKLTGGHKITRDQVIALIVRNATKQDAEYVNSMWELHEDLWKRAAAKEERRTGVPVDGRKPLSYKLKLATGETVNLTGGYKRIEYDKDLSSILQDLGMKGDLFEEGYVPAIVTPHSYTIKPTKYIGPLDFSGSMESAKLAGMVHDIAFRDVVLDVRKLLMSKPATAEGGFREASKKKFGVYMDRLWDGWLKDIANSHLVEDDFLRGFSRALAIIRQNVVGSLIFLSRSVSLKHGLTALGQSTAQVGPKAMVSGLYNIGASGMVGAFRDLGVERGMEPDPGFAASFQRIAKPGKRGASARAFIYNSSPMMRARRRQYRNSLRGAIEALGQAGWRKGLVDARQISLSVGRVAVAVSDSLSADAEWDAAYSKHFRATGDHDEAVNIADRAVTRAHGSSFVGDRSAILRSRNEWVRNTALLFSYWNHFTNNMIQLGWDVGARFSRGAGSEPGATIPSISARIAYYLLLATIADTLAEYIFTKEKRPLWVRGLRALTRQITGGIYGLREVGSLALGYEPTAGAIGIMFQNLARAGKDLYRYMATGKGSRDWLKHVTGAIGMMTGIGGVQLGADAQKAADFMTGEEERPTRGGGNVVRGSTR